MSETHATMLAVEHDELVSTINDKRFCIGSLSVRTLAELRSRVCRGGI
jgi:hypothetical protein